MSELISLLSVPEYLLYNPLIIHRIYLAFDSITPQIAMADFQDCIFATKDDLFA